MSIAPLQPLLSAAELKLEVILCRAKAPLVAEYEQRDERVELALPGMLYHSPVMRELARQIYKIQGSAATVLVLGETGTGKELVAHAIHHLSTRRDQPFVAFNCANVSRDLIEAQLFGYRKGAFTGAVQPSEGVIRAATGGTLFLDEVAELPLDLQPKLLRFLQEGEIHPLGTNKPHLVNVRVVAATNRCLEEMVRVGKFREDLYFRLNVIPLQVPPLRARHEEIVLLARHFLAQLSAREQKVNLQFAPNALDALTVYDWPGNVRQLQHEIQRLVALASSSTVLQREHLSAELRATRQPGPPQKGTSRSRAGRGVRAFPDCGGVCPLSWQCDPDRKGIGADPARPARQVTTLSNRVRAVVRSNYAPCHFPTHLLVNLCHC